MARRKRKTPKSNASDAGDPTAEAALSESDSDKKAAAPKSALEKLRDAFSQMVGSSSKKSQHSENTAEDDTESEDSVTEFDPCPVTPTSILEAMLFVGHPNNEPLASKEAASLMRGVSSREISGLVKKLNASYQASGSPYTIVRENKGYRMTLHADFDRLLHKFYGRVKEAKLSKAAVEVLAIIAYNQPATADTVNDLRGSQSGSFLSQLVRRGLLKLERPKEPPRKPIYSTTDRFLKVFNLTDLEDLPRSEQLDER